MILSNEMYSLLRDPADLGRLELDGPALINPVTGKHHAILDSIPILLDQTGIGPRNRKVQRMYNWFCFIYDAGMSLENLLYRGKIDEIRRTLAEKLSIKSGDCCLYTSIGTGADLPFLRERTSLETIRLIGLDLSMGMLRYCKARLTGHEQTSLLVQANAERLPFGERVFDVVYHLGGINFFDQPALAVKEMLRVAKPGALVLFADETKKPVNTSYRMNPLTRAYVNDEATILDPREWIPEGVSAVSYEEVWDGRGYLISFRAV